MTNEAFRELVNLFLDGELSVEEEERLNAEINASPERARQFHEASRLHDAMQMVLDPQALQPKDLDEPLPWARIIFGIGVAACLALGTLIVVPSLVVKEVDGEVSDAGFVEEIRRVEARRYAATQQEQPHQCSLAAQLRLVGLMPEITPSDRELRPADCSAVVRRRVIIVRDLKLPEATTRFVAKVHTFEPEEAQQHEVLAFPVYNERSRSVSLQQGLEASLVSF